MNMYIVVEGKHTEINVYPAWLAFVAPKMTRIDNPRNVCSNNYYLISGEGIPSIYNHILHAVEDINEINKQKNGLGFNYLVVGIDVEEESREQIKDSIAGTLKDNNVTLDENVKMILLEQKVCIKSWFLGNRAVFKDNPQSKEFADLIKKYNVKNENPENMNNLDPQRFSNKAQFHLHYLKQMFKERHMNYGKNRTGEVCKETYLEQLIKRYGETSHIQSFGRWLDFMSNL